MKEFVYIGHASRVVFGAGSIARLPGEMEQLGVERALLLSTPEQAANVKLVAARLGCRAAGVYDKAAMHVPMEIVEDARRVATEVKADCCIAIGGGSTTGLGKAIALSSNLPIIAVPTTYAGSEMTPIYGLTEGGVKTTGRDARVLPKTVIYDPELTVTLPAVVSAASGMNAMAHCVEALYAADANPVVSLMAEEGIRALSSALTAIVSNPADMDARGAALYGAWLAGISLASAGMALHHKLCHVLGGRFNLPHAETHSVVLPHVARYNCDAAPEAMARVARALGASFQQAIDGKDVPVALWELGARLGISMKLAQIGFNKSDLEGAAKIATQSPYPNPRPVDYAGVLTLLRDAYEGLSPQGWSRGLGHSALRVSDTHMVPR